MTEVQPLVTLLTKKYVDLTRGFQLEHGFSTETRDMVVESLGYAAAVVVLGFQVKEVGRLAFDTALTRAIENIKGYRDSLPKGEGNANGRTVEKPRRKAHRVKGKRANVRRSRKGAKSLERVNR